MNGQQFSQLLRLLDPHTYAKGSTDLYTYLVYCNHPTKKDSRGRKSKRFVLKKIRHENNRTHILYFDRCWEVLPHMSCKSMSLHGTCLSTQERISHYLVH